MRTFIFKRLAAAVPILALGATVTFIQPVAALQQPQVQAKVEGEEGVEVLARGPLHEAFASTAEQPVAGEIVKKQPPESIEELPPDQKPDGDNVQWIPGYWHYDEDRADYIWISGFWRVVPPGRVWVPGSWREAKGGYQWAPGFWSEAAPVQPNQEPAPAQLEYLPPPPAPLELAPSTPQPTATSFYVTGSWMYRSNRYAWRPGYWVEYRPNWVWVPACYRWSPLGYIYIGGYWDYTLGHRGVLFAPVAFRPGYVRRPNYYYTPAYMVPEASLYSTMFVRRGYGGYYFGDYYEQRYYNSGYVSWAGVTVRGSNFAVTVGVGRPAPVYDPLWSYYSIAYRDTPRWSVGITNAYVGRYDGTVARPPRTLVQQTTIVNNTTINNTTVNNTTINNNTMLSSFRNATTAKTTPLTLKAVNNADRVVEQKHAQDIQKVAVERKKQETTLVDRGLTPKTTSDTVRAVKLDVPKNAVVRAQVPTTKAPPPVPSATTNTTPVTPKPVDPVTPKPVDPKNPKPVDPKNPRPIDPKNPKPVDPKTPVTPVTPPVVPPVVKPPVVTPPVVTPPKPVVPVTPPVVVPPKPMVPVTPPVVVPPKPVVPVTPPVVAPPKPMVPVTPPVVVPPKPVVPVTPPVVAPPKPVVPVTPPVVVPPKPVVPVTPPPVVVPPRPPVMAPPTPVTPAPTPNPKGPPPTTKDKDKKN